MKNIVILCDGTGNDIGDVSQGLSNVLKLYRCLRKTDRAEPQQAVFYGAGVGVLEEHDPWQPWQRIKRALVSTIGLAAGYGLDNNVLDAYEFLIRYYEPGDRIYMFGFSRGAYTVRVLAALLHKVGLLSPYQVNLMKRGLTAYKRFSADPRQRKSAELDPYMAPHVPIDPAAQFARVISSRWPLIRFVGVWDTVASVIVPRPDRFYIPNLEKLAYTEVNPSIETFRQAMSIDERRRMYRLQRWDEPQTFTLNRFNDAGARSQDIKQVWFAGVHSDIGGGYPEIESGLSKYPLLWMIEQAIEAGLKVNPATVNQLAWGVERKNSAISYVAPNPQAILHESLHGAWWPFEFFPRDAKHKEWPARSTIFGRYIPNAEPRLIPEGASIHESVIARMKSVPEYCPVNLPTRFETVRMPAPPSRASSEDSDEF